MKIISGLALIAIGILLFTWTAKRPSKSSPSQDFKLYVGALGLIALGSVVLFGKNGWH